MLIETLPPEANIESETKIDYTTMKTRVISQIKQVIILPQCNNFTRYTHRKTKDRAQSLRELISLV